MKTTFYKVRKWEVQGIPCVLASHNLTKLMRIFTFYLWFNTWMTLWSFSSMLKTIFSKGNKYEIHFPFTYFFIQNLDIIYEFPLLFRFLLKFFGKQVIETKVCLYSFSHGAHWLNSTERSEQVQQASKRPLWTPTSSTSERVQQASTSEKAQQASKRPLNKMQNSKYAYT